jgi:hypothetical protein
MSMFVPPMSIFPYRRHRAPDTTGWTKEELELWHNYELVLYAGTVGLGPIGDGVSWIRRLYGALFSGAVTESSKHETHVVDGAILGKPIE